MAETLKSIPVETNYSNKKVQLKIQKLIFRKMCTKIFVLIMNDYKLGTFCLQMITILCVFQINIFKCNV